MITTTEAFAKTIEQAGVIPNQYDGTVDTLVKLLCIQTSDDPEKICNFLQEVISIIQEDGVDDLDITLQERLGLLSQYYRNWKEILDETHN